jgi:hypothetical protein
MASARQRDAARLRARRRRPRTYVERHAGRIVLAGVLSSALLLTLLLTAFGSGSPGISSAPLTATGVHPGGRPMPQSVASAGTLQIQLPIAQSAVTAIGYHRAGNGALSLDPVGRQGNAGLFSRLWHRIAGSKDTGLVWYQLSGGRGPGTSALDVGAAPGTDVYSPVAGTVVGITDYVISNRVHGARIEIRPQEAPSIVVSLTHLRPDPALTVGSAVAAAGSKIGVVLDLSRIERQSLARFTQDAGNNVSLEVHPAATLSVR